MSINFPTSLDTLTNPTGTDLLENAVAGLDHDVQHSNANDAIEALEAKVGANSSAVTTSHDYKLGEVIGTDKAVGKTATQTLTNKTITSPQINFGSDARGDIMVRNSSGVSARLPVGTSGQILAANVSGDPEWIANPSASDASTTVKGVVEEATQAEVDAGTAAGGTSARLFVNPSTISSKFSNFYGDGSDGDVTITSGTTTLTSDKYYNNLTIDSGGILETAGYRVFVKGTLTNSSGGIIQNNGVNGTAGGNATAGGVGAAGTGGTAAAAVTVFSTGGAGGAGGIGTNVNGGGTAGAASTAVTNSVGAIGGAGAQGGNGIGPGTNTGGAGGTVGTVTASASGLKDLFSLFIQGNLTGVWKAGTSGSGGGSGASSSNSGNGTSGGGGGGGSAGGVVWIAARYLAGTGVIKSIGGNGGAGGSSNIHTATSPGGVGGSSGGGGGAGGVIILMSTTSANPYTMTLTGGTGGTGGAGAINGGTLANGVSGSNGSAGTSVFIVNNA